MVGILVAVFKKLNGTVNSISIESNKVFVKSETLENLDLIRVEFITSFQRY